MYSNRIIQDSYLTVVPPILRTRDKYAKYAPSHVSNVQKRKETKKKKQESIPYFDQRIKKNVPEPCFYAQKRGSSENFLKKNMALSAIKTRHASACKSSELFLRLVWKGLISCSCKQIFAYLRVPRAFSRGSYNLTRVLKETSAWKQLILR